MRASAGPHAGDVSSQPRFTRTDAALVLAGAGLTVVLAAAVTRRPVQGVALLVVVALVAFVLLARERLARLRISALLVAGMVVLLPAALRGPSCALPGGGHLFLFRGVLAPVLHLGITDRIGLTRPLPFAAQD